MKHRLSFGYFTLLSENIVEVTIDEGVELSLEMIEECDAFFKAHIFGDFGMLINRVNDYSYSYEAQLTLGSYQGLKAIAFVYYSEQSKTLVDNIQQTRRHDKLNSRIFSGLELEWQQALQWLQGELKENDQQVIGNLIQG
ncbi:hypothetical protein SAMN05216262_10783 [Colwellia chukchiensis]|uniref:SpoIIAA-like n=1 Tax=Colwellia chukchiensis TaxID=641665 RepID=A0A1H7NAU8_9GAMM|nr:hypothetical protein [Colwellia chukchiensis]SEL20610.1 hypothetical protein SAMN05216262_10783 [Colwellia chukchiensis]